VGPRAFPIQLASSPAPSSTRSSSPDAASAEPDPRGLTARSPPGASRLASAAGGSLERGSGSGGDPRRGAAWLSGGRTGDARRNVRAWSDLHASARRWPVQPRLGTMPCLVLRWQRLLAQGCGAGRAALCGQATPRRARGAQAAACACGVCWSHHPPLCAGCTRRECDVTSQVVQHGPDLARLLRGRSWRRRARAAAAACRRAARRA
jgi:hypothetical protein